MCKFLSVLALNGTSTNRGGLQNLSLQWVCPTMAVTWARLGHRTMAGHSCSFPPAHDSAQVERKEVEVRVPGFNSHLCHF